jgi:hypothetical protein
MYYSLKNNQIFIRITIRHNTVVVVCKNMTAANGIGCQRKHIRMQTTRNGGHQCPLSVHYSPLAASPLLRRMVEAWSTKTVVNK